MYHRQHCKALWDHLSHERHTWCCCTIWLNLAFSTRKSRLRFRLLPSAKASLGLGTDTYMQAGLKLWWASSTGWISTLASAIRQNKWNKRKYHGTSERGDCDSSWQLCLSLETLKVIRWEETSTSREWKQKMIYRGVEERTTKQGTKDEALPHDNELWATWTFNNVAGQNTKCILRCSKQFHHKLNSARHNKIIDNQNMHDF